MAEKLLLKKTLFEELKSTNDKIKELEDFKKKEHAFVSSVETQLKCLTSHKEFVQRLIDICVNRNKF